MTIGELLEVVVMITSFGHDEARWGYRETRVYEHCETQTFWAQHVYVTTGDEGGVEPEGEPYQVTEAQVTTTQWVKVKPA